MVPLNDPAPVDTRPYFRPVSTALVTLLRTLEPGDWQRTTIAGTWRVRDVVAHLTDVSLRRLSFHRDRMVPPSPPEAIESEQDFVRFINGINAQWVAAANRLSPRLLTDLFELASRDLADWFESVPFDAPALFAVSWAGEQRSAGWFDIGREFTELWHHQQQVRMAVGAPPLADPRHLRAVLDIAVRGLPHAFRDVQAKTGETLMLEATGPSGGAWTLSRQEGAWRLFSGGPASATTRVSVSDDDAWRLLFNALDERAAAAAVSVEGRQELAAPLLRARSVVV
jgi:uncharacterized protein (TIGR03083 family)